MLSVRKVIKLLQNPLGSKGVDASRGLYLKQMTHVRSKYAGVIELLSHRTHLLSAYRSPHPQTEQAKHTLTRTEYLSSDM